MAQEQSDTRKILQELAALKRKINEIEVSVARRNNNVLRETFGTLKIKRKPDLRKFFGAYKFKQPVEEIMDEIDRDLYD